MWPGMRPATGWIAYFDVDALGLEQLRELAHLVLRLRDGEAVARDDDDALRVREHHGDVVGRGRANGRAVGARRGRRPGRDLAERAEEDVRDRAVHRAAHLHRQQRSGRADEHPAHDQDVRVQHEAGRGRGEAGERVQQRDHDRHVRAADRQDEQDAEERARATIIATSTQKLGAVDHRRRRARRAGEHERVHELLARDT